MDAEGRPTTDVATALGGLPTPLGGYKGSGLAVMVEIFCAVLSGGAMLTQVGGLRIFERPMNIGQFFLALDVSRFMPLDAFAERMRQLQAILKDTRPADGYDEVLLAGEPEWRAEEVRRRDGIPVEDGVWQALARTAHELNVRIPETGQIE
jgi:LDH2 family malate/lactate/ureidoglycolate dehydrogenase